MIVKIRRGKISIDNKKEGIRVDIPANVFLRKPGAIPLRCLPWPLDDMIWKDFLKKKLRGDLLWGEGRVLRYWGDDD